MTKAEMGPAIHNIGLCGLTGVIFAVLTSSLILYLEGFVTTSWSVNNATHSGLWQTCISTTREDGAGYLMPVQVLTSVSLFGIIAAFGLIVIYMTANRASKNISILCLCAVCILTAYAERRMYLDTDGLIPQTGIFGAILMCASVIVYGVNQDSGSNLSWSYYVTVAAAILSLLAAILSIVQTRRSNVRL